MPKNHGPWFTCTDLLEFLSNFSFLITKSFSSSTTMLCGFSEEFETSYFLEINNSLVGLVISTCTLKGPCVFQWLL